MKNSTIEILTTSDDDRAQGLKIIQMPIGNLRPYDKNPRVNDDAIGPVAKSISEFGFRSPIVVDKDNVIICGHTRLKAAQKLGLAMVPVHVAADLSPEQVKALRLADNRTSELSRWDLELLGLEVEDLEQLNFSIEEFGFSELELNQIFGEKDPVKQGKTNPDDIPETPQEPVSKRGEVYILGRHRLMCGDATEKDDLIKLMNGQEADLWLTDPPYNVAYEGEHGLKIKNDNMKTSEFDDFLRRAFGLVALILKPGASFYIFHSTSTSVSFLTSLAATGMAMRQILVWVKNGFVMSRQDYHYAHEPIIYGWKDGASHSWFSDRKQSTVVDVPDQPFVKRDDGRWQLKVRNHIYSIPADAVCEEEPTTVIEHPRPIRNDVHPTMKPVELLIRLLKHSCQRGDIIMDTFGGSGSTLIAAEQTGRKAFLMELDERYADVIWKRYAEFIHGVGCAWEKLTPAEDSKHD
ncbi:DNA modification methylase [Oligosphaera ethanolica]|uniref:site-specific DNA-methyltransferase (adenine-specific) n=1 Tax=Oligosphaera ethanolica TaxID=760260 RepID=A0AAE4AQF1_9BACT|nr:DNA modification methylase [Oligosphaera ethanolica]MDQ0291028.1 site-specific DNA-methyltransferase (adenine-specific) [Oligosphaera ethanolica]